MKDITSLFNGSIDEDDYIITTLKRCADNNCIGCPFEGCSGHIIAQLAISVIKSRDEVIERLDDLNNSLFAQYIRVQRRLENAEKKDGMK